MRKVLTGVVVLSLFLQIITFSHSLSLSRSLILHLSVSSSFPSSHLPLSLVAAFSPFSLISPNLDPHTTLPL